MICLEERNCARKYTLNGIINILIKEKDIEIILAKKKINGTIYAEQDCSEKNNSEPDGSRISCQKD